MNLTNNQRQAINLAAAEVMGLEVYHSVNERQEIKHKVWLFAAKGMHSLYDITQNPQQMNEFIGKVKMDVIFASTTNSWEALTYTEDFEQVHIEGDPDRPTAIIKCAASFLNVKLEPVLESER